MLEEGWGVGEGLHRNLKHTSLYRADRGGSSSGKRTSESDVMEVRRRERFKRVEIINEAL